MGNSRNRISRFVWSAWYLCLLGAPLCMFCSCSDNVAGGSEIGNPIVVTGIINGSDGSPSENAEVLLLAADYNPVDDDPPPDYAVDTTDANGRYRFTPVDSGTYTIFATHSLSGTRLFHHNVVVAADSVPVKTVMLTKTGTIQVNLSSQVDSLNGYVFIRGTPLMQKIVTTDKLFIDSVPIGRIPTVHYIEKGNIQSLTIIENDIPVGPSDTVEIPYDFSVLFVVTGDTIDFDTVTEYVDGLDDSSNYYSYIHREYIKESDGFIITRTTDVLTPDDTVGIDLIFLAYTAELDPTMAALFRSITKPVIVGNPAMYPELGMTGTQEGVDWGIELEYRIIMKEVQHPIAAGLTGNQLGTTIPRMGWGAHSGGVTIGDAPSPPFHPLVFCYTTGDQMAGTSAPHKRIGFYGQNTLLTDAGIALLKNAVRWAVDDK